MGIRTMGEFPLAWAALSRLYLAVAGLRLVCLMRHPPNQPLRLRTIFPFEGEASPGVAYPRELWGDCGAQHNRQAKWC